MYETPKGEACQFGDEQTLGDYCLFHVPEEIHDRSDGELSDLLHERVVQLIEQTPSQQKLDMRGVVFACKPLDLSHRTLPSLDLRYSIVQQPINFECSTLSTGTKLDSATFRKNANFNSTTFPGSVSFSNATFEATSSFCAASFKSDALFMHTMFQDDTDFHETAFDGATCFNYAQFQGTSRFSSTRFSNLALFYSAEFESANFRSAQFLGPALFGSAKFTDHAAFDLATFRKDVVFSATTFNNGADFSGPLTHKTELPSADFQDAVFRSSTSFRSRVFVTAPLFHQATLHQNTNLDCTDFQDVASDGAARAYRTLKLAMEHVRSRHEEARFYALEQKALRHHVETPTWANAASWIYEQISDFGRDALRPLILLSSLSTVATLVYWIAASTRAEIAVGDAIGGSAQLLGRCADFAVKQIINPFELWKLQGRIEAHQLFPSASLLNVIKYLSTLQSVLSATLLAVFGLALRWRFRRD